MSKRNQRIVGSFSTFILPLVLLGLIADTTWSQEPEPHGQLVIGDTEYQVFARSCNLSGEDDSEGGNTLSGLAIGPDGRRHLLEVSRTSLSFGLSHSVFVSLGGGEGWSAERMRMGGGWRDSAGGMAPDEPLIEIDGRTIRAEGTFERQREEETAEGRLEMTCPADR